MDLKELKAYTDARIEYLNIEHETVTTSWERVVISSRINELLRIYNFALKLALTHQEE